MRIEWNKRHVHVFCVSAYTASVRVYLHMYACEHVCPCKCGSTGLSRCVCVCVAALSQPSAPPAGKGPGLRHQLQAGMRMAESQTDTAVGYYV